MKLRILCPISKKEIEDPVIVDGYTYDRASIIKLINDGVLIKSRDQLINDYFMQALLDYIKKKNTAIIALNNLDDLYECPITRGFPIKGVLCLADGRTYEERNIINSYLIRKRSPYTNCLITQYDLVYNQMHVLLRAEINKAINAEKTFVDLETIFCNYEQQHPHFVSMKASDWKQTFIPDIMMLQIYFFLNLPRMLSHPFNRSELLGMQLQLLTMASYVYNDFKLYRKFVLSFIDNVRNQEFDLYRISSNKRNVILISWCAIFLKNAIWSYNLLKHIQLYALLPNIGVFNLVLFKVLTNISALSGISFFAISRSLVEFNSLFILLKTELLDIKIKNYLSELFDKDAARHQRKSTLAIRAEGISTLIMFAALLPLAIVGVSVKSSMYEEEISWAFLLNFVVNLPLVMLTTTTAINQIREWIFSRGDSNVKTSTNSNSFFNRVCTGFSFSARAIAGVTTFSAFPSTGFLSALGLALNKAAEPSFAKCWDDFNTNTPSFKRLDLQHHSSSLNIV